MPSVLAEIEKQGVSSHWASGPHVVLTVSCNEPDGQRYIPVQPTSQFARSGDTNGFSVESRQSKTNQLLFEF